MLQIIIVRARLILLPLLFLAVFQNAAFAGPPYGYTETVHMWGDVREKAAKYRLVLQNLYAEAESAQRHDRSRTNAEFSRRLARDYPGSLFFAGSHGILAVNNYTTVSFDTHWNITQLKQKFESLEKAYDFRNNTFTAVAGPNRVAFRLDLNRPERSLFTSASIPAISVNAEQVWAKRQPSAQSRAPLRDLLNDVYAHRLAAAGFRMDKLAEDLITGTAARASVLQAATEIYSSKTIGRPEGAKGLVSGPENLSNPGSALESLSSAVTGMAVFLFLLVFFALVLRILVGRAKKEIFRKLRQVFWTIWQAQRQGPPQHNRNGEFDEAEDWLGDLGKKHPSRQVKTQEWSTTVLQSLEWKRFETVCAEYLRMIGYDPRETRIGADGGVDIWVYKVGCDKPIGLVQCKAWATYKVGVKPVRELFGVMAAEGIAYGKFITSGEFTEEALQFAKGKRLQLISGGAFIDAIRKLPVEEQRKLLYLALDGDYQTPTCPQCGTKMTIREGASSRKFWGCPAFPRCRATLVYKEKFAFE